MKNIKYLFAGNGEMILSENAAAARECMAQHFPCMEVVNGGWELPILWTKMGRFYLRRGDFYFWEAWPIGEWLLEDLEADWYFCFGGAAGLSIWRMGVEELVDVFDGAWLEAARSAGLVGFWRAGGGAYAFKFEFEPMSYGSARLYWFTHKNLYDSELFESPEWLWHPLFRQAEAFAMVIEREEFTSMAMSLRKLVCKYHEQGRESEAAEVYSFMEIYGDTLWGDLAFFYFYEDLTIIYRGNGAPWTKRIANYLSPSQLRTIWG